MKLRFYARAGCLENWPGSKAVGQPPRYIGRTFVASDKPGVLGALVADREPVELDDGSPDAPRLMRKCLKGGLWPADKETAARCGVDFVAVEQDADGEWVARKATAPAFAKPKSEPKAEL